ncbi:replication protein A 70 kDa DNA-binding subunit B [Tanacetum coccineum]|uniref:Replication protein A 70 kDa DNA-binding subunit B n=1 Tax=Tanacetum coccineum TaxID=301880 RepID=A0ABQ5A0E8_9ASTR
MGYQKTPTLSINDYKKNTGVGGSAMGYQKTPNLSSNNYKKNIGVGGSAMSYQKTPTLSGNNYKKNVGVGGSGSFGGSSGNHKDKKITPISEVDPMLNDITIQGRCISIWHSHRMNAAHDPYSLDLVLQDVHNTRIQVYIKKEFMFRFEPLFEEGQCYILSNFGIAENSGRLPLLPHRYKISFYKCTTVTRIEPFDNNTNGFILEPFHHLLDPEHHQYYENDVVDVIGLVVGIGDIVPVIGNRLDFTFWDTWASMWDQYANKRDAIKHLVIILQLGKVKYWDGIPAIHNALFGTKIFINRNILEIVAFKKERNGYDANQVKIKLFSLEFKVVSIAEFFHGAINRMVGDIRDSKPVYSYCIVYARIHKIHKEHGWAYTACKQCNKKVDILPRQNRPPVYVCEEHGNVQPASRFKVIVRVIDESGSAPLLFFNNNFVKLSGHTAWEIIEKYNMDPDEYWPEEELDHIIGKKCLFKLFYSEYNVTKNNHTYRCDSFFENVELINHFKKNFIDTESDDEGINRGLNVVVHDSDMYPASKTKKNMAIIEDNKAIIKESSDEHVSDMHTTSKKKINKAIIEESRDERDLDMQTPTKTRKSTSRVKVSTSKKRKLIIDEHEVEK